ncbi:MAG: enolase C-terminal domain-like protein, partial [Catenulispora sp.]
TIGHVANLHVVASLLQSTKPAEWNDPSNRTHAVFDNPPVPVDGLFRLPDGPGLGLVLNEAELAARRVEL